MATSAFRPRYHIADFLKFTAILCVTLALFSRRGSGLALQENWPAFVVCSIGLAVACALVFARPKVTFRQCESCGKRFFPRSNVEQNELCRVCRRTKLSPQQHRRLAIQGFVIITVVLLILSCVLLWPFSGSIQARLGWFAIPLIAIGLCIAMIIVVAGSMVVWSVVTMWRMSNPAHALSVARACAGEAGELRTFGSVSVYLFGPDDPTSMFTGQMEICRSRFESLVGESIEHDRPLRVLAFSKRDSFEAFFRRAFLSGGNLDGMYVPWSMPTISITTQFPAHRLADPEQVARVLASYFLLNIYKKGPTPFWAQTGLAHVVARGGDEMELARLNRRVLAALSRGTSLGIGDLFHAKPRSIVTLVRDWREFTNFSRYTQLIDQSCSVVEFLCSEKERLERFLEFVRERNSKARIEQHFQHHFGYGFEMLLERWKSWVLGRGTGFHRSPPSDICNALLERVIPIVQNPGMDRLERIQAIREMGKAGYVLSADALIEVLAADDQIPAEEIVWSLESISGLALGTNVNRWADWLSHVPRETTRVADLAQCS